MRDTPPVIDRSFRGEHQRLLGHDIEFEDMTERIADNNKHAACMENHSRDEAGVGHASTVDGAPDNHEEDGQAPPVVYRVYKRRWFGLMQLVLMNITVSWDVSWTGTKYLRCDIWTDLSSSGFPSPPSPTQQPNTSTPPPPSSTGCPPPFSSPLSLPPPSQSTPSIPAAPVSLSSLPRFSSSPAIGSAMLAPAPHPQTSPSPCSARSSSASPNPSSSALQPITPPSGSPLAPASPPPQ